MTTEKYLALEVQGEDRELYTFSPDSPDFEKALLRVREELRGEWVRSGESFDFSVRLRVLPELPEGKRALDGKVRTWEEGWDG